jgi:Leucine-rich repeat (LRR) protein
MTRRITPQGLQQLLQRIIRNGKLVVEHLDLWDGRIGNQGVSTLLAKIPGASLLTRLDLRNNQIDDKGAVLLAGAMTALKDNQVDDDEAKALTGEIAPHLTVARLYLKNNLIGDSGAIALANVLANNTTLIYFDLAENLIGDTGAVAFAGAVVTNSTLSRLTLRNNRIGNNGAIAIANALPRMKNTKPFQLDLANNKIGRAGLMALANAIANASTPIRLTFRINVKRDARTFIDKLMQCGIFFHFDLDFANKQIGDAGAKVLAKAIANMGNPASTKLALRIENDGAITMTNVPMENIALDLEGNWIGDAGAIAFADAIASNSTLGRLTLRNNRICNNGAMAVAYALAKNTTLTNLNLKRNPINHYLLYAIDRMLACNEQLAKLSTRTSATVLLEEKDEKSTQPMPDALLPIQTISLAKVGWLVMALIVIPYEEKHLHADDKTLIADIIRFCTRRLGQERCENLRTTAKVAIAGKFDEAQSQAHRQQLIKQLWQIVQSSSKDMKPLVISFLVNMCNLKPKGADQQAEISELESALVDAQWLPPTLAG